MVKTERQEMFEEQLEKMSKKIYDSSITYIDAIVLLEIGNKLLLNFEDMSKSRDKWKAKYMELKETTNKSKGNKSKTETKHINTRDYKE